MMCGFICELAETNGKACGVDCQKDKGKRDVAYEIGCIGTNAGWKYRITIWNGRAAYQGQRFYMNHKDAKRAAEAMGIPARDA